MVKQLSKTESRNVIGVEGTNTRNGTLKADEFLPELRGKRAIRKYREMRDNDSTIGASLYAVEQMLRDVKINVKPADDSEEAKAKSQFLEEVLEDMDHSLDDHISEALSFLTFGFAAFEVVYKRREGPYQTNLKKRSKYSDGYMGVRKIASRAQWTVNRFDVDDKTGELLGFYQDVTSGFDDNYIPSRKSILYRTTVVNGDYSGRSILRNAYSSYERLNALQQYEAIAVERELAGIPVIELPSEYLSSNATDDQRAVLNQFKEIGRDLKFNEQGFLMIPSDTYPGKDGEPTNQKLVNVRLMSSEGTRNIDIDPVVKRYQHDIARSVLAEFIMLGSGSGSYALSKSKSDIFLRSLESYIHTIVDILNKQLVEPLWRLNGFDFKYLPKIVAGDVAPHDLKDLGGYLRNLNSAGITYADDIDIVNALLDQAELPNVDEEAYKASRERAASIEQARVAPDNPREDDEEEEKPSEDK